MGEWEPVVDLEQNTGPCPECGALLHHPSEDYEYSDDGVPKVVAGLGGFWCAACGWDEAAEEREA